MITAMDALERALRASATSAGCPLEPLEHDATSWHSPTFSGERHLLKFAAAKSPELRAWLDALPEANIIVPRHLIADIEVVSAVALGDYAELVLEVLTVEESVDA